MTDPENPWAPDHRPPLQHGAVPPEAGWGYDPAAGGYGYPGYGYGVPPPKRPWYKAPGSLVGAALFTALNAWVTVVMILVGISVVSGVEDEEGFFEALAAGLLALVLIAFVATIGFTTFCFALMGAVATVPLVVVWFKEPRRSTTAGLHVVHAVVALAAMGVAVVRIS